MAVLEAKFMDNLGFNYRHFLSLFQPIEVEKAKYNDLRHELEELNDKLNSGRLLKETFKRAIDLCKLDLQPSEIELIIN